MNSVSLLAVSFEFPYVHEAGSHQGAQRGQRQRIVITHRDGRKIPHLAQLRPVERAVVKVLIGRGDPRADVGVALRAQQLACACKTGHARRRGHLDHRADAQCHGASELHQQRKRGIPVGRPQILLECAGDQVGGGDLHIAAVIGLGRCKWQLIPTYEGLEGRALQPVPSTAPSGGYLPRRLDH